MRTFLAALVDDLRDRRLLPVVVALIVAIVAVPLLLSNDPEPDPVPAAPAGAGAGGDGPPVVPAVEDPQAPPAGPEKDPFRPKGSGSTSERGTTAGAPTARVPTPPPPPRTTTSPSPASSPSTGSRPSAPAPAAEPVTTYRATIAYVEGGRTRTASNPPRYQPFPSGTTNPAVLYYGAAADGDSAYFLTGPGVARVTGGRCVPARSECRVLEIETGRSARITTITPRTPRVSRVRVVGVTRAALAPAAARREAARSSDLGRCIAGPEASLDLTQGGALSSQGLSPARCRSLLRRVGP